jgi:spoIIIJ-associated protein
MAEVDPDSLGDSEKTAYQILKEICEASGLAIRPVIREHTPPYLQIELVGEDAAHAFGRYGRHLDALQFLANLIIGRRTGADVRVSLDAAGYRAHRAATLEKLAREMAAQVKERQEECEFDPMSAQDRRIIHNALKDDPDVITYSEGEEPHRRVIIAPR